MKKILYILSLMALVLSGCVNNSDEPQPPVVPPPAPPIVATSADLLGTWETYYYMKEIYFMYQNGDKKVFPGLRLTDYDGYRTQFYEEDGKYKYKSFNVVGNVNDEGTYSALKDTVYFRILAKNGVPADSTTKHVIRRLEPDKGILKTDDIYYGTTAGSGYKYEIIDTRAHRNTAIAPTFSDASPAKVMIDFAEMSKAPWDVIGGAYYRNGSYYSYESEIIDKALVKSETTYEFYTRSDNQKMCKISSLYPDTNERGEETYELMIFDDVIYFFFEDSGKLADFNMWVTSWKTENGVNKFIDKKWDRYNNDISIVVQVEHHLTQRRN
ncbi:hypothetical protein [Prevotella sp. 10(H)]|uniref:hypothetical protein n=1 Tax=Prevotella sp. 10(H) TaxID=1158294 RepID=UPI0012DED28B|nr:hypothetical protein [Prevotella sp. 10(H)]